MWSLHTVIENIKKISIFSIVGIIILALLWSIASNILTYLNRPKYIPPAMAFGQLPPIPFTENTQKQTLTYQLATVDGKADLTDPNSGQVIPESDRIYVFQLQQAIPDLNSLQNARTKVAAVGITNADGSPITEKRISETEYSWNKTDGFAKAISVDIGSDNFHLSSIYNLYPAVLDGDNMPSDQNAITAVQDFLNTMQIMPKDIDPSLTTTTDYTIQNGSLVPVTTAGQKILAVKVNFFQQAVNSLPVVYPNPPDSTMSFLVTGGDSSPEIAQATFEYQTIDTSTQGVSDYPLKTTQQAYADLQAGKAYIIPSFTGNSNQISIKTISLAYYLGETPQAYLMPVYVFTDNNGFIAYVSAVDDSVIQIPSPSPGS